MGPPTTLNDTNILIECLRHVALAEVELSRRPPHHISIVTWIEVMAGAPITRAEDTRAFLATFTILPLTPEIAERTAAQHENRTFVTRNTRDFSTTAFELYIPYTL